jgi:hypothetical protein
MQECFNFGQSQWLAEDLSTQWGGVRSDPQKGDNIVILGTLNPEKLIVWWFSPSNPTSTDPR